MAVCSRSSSCGSSAAMRARAARGSAVGGHGGVGDRPGGARAAQDEGDLADDRARTGAAQADLLAIRPVDDHRDPAASGR